MSNFIGSGVEGVGWKRNSVLSETNPNKTKKHGML